MLFGLFEFFFNSWFTYVWMISGIIFTVFMMIHSPQYWDLHSIDTKKEKLNQVEKKIWRTRMIKIRITGLPDDLECFLNKLRKHFFILDVSDPCKNSNSKYVRIYADVQEDKDDEC